MLHILPLHPESPAAITLKSLVPAQLPIHKYQLLNPVTPTPTIHCKKKKCQGRVSEALMHGVNREVMYIGTKYSIQIDPIYFDWDTFIPTLESHFPDIAEELMNHGHLRYALVHNEGKSIPASSSELNTNFRCGVTDGGQTPRAPSPHISTTKNQRPSSMLWLLLPQHTRDTLQLSSQSSNHKPHLLCSP